VIEGLSAAGPEAQSRQVRLFFSYSSGNLFSFRVELYPQARVQGIIPCHGVWGRGGPRVARTEKFIFFHSCVSRVFRLDFSGQTTGFCDRIPAKDDPKAKACPAMAFLLNERRKSARDRCHLSGMPV